MISLLPIIVFAFVTSITPGPNNFMVLSSCMNYGYIKTIPHIFGIALGFPIMLICVGVGIGALFDKYPELYLYLKYICFIYFIYLCYKIGSTRIENIEISKRKPLTFYHAAFFQWVNPKAWLIAITAISTLTTGTINIVSQIFLIAFIFMLISIPCITTWGFMGKVIDLHLDKKYQKYINIMLGIIMFITVSYVMVLNSFN